ncbi:hypothetical protein MGYG_04071 [Nannizzia gypsea CBS 118893]|uniref:Uncharacterized protein n=1 Tax=Arthroderma gypseum (strain ATCC MYA-4604 / CBS 118893) TaxID=535722 RepID=E4UUV1_ARTGP|nr:hypothetical protein MGYG_04071 [Nannizzia gypsea CBS 118893]EFR01068.1 hypothetical protein MGYG_04071 [Nannizzia gypsea CBS 118893]
MMLDMLASNAGSSPYAVPSSPSPTLPPPATASSPSHPPDNRLSQKKNKKGPRYDQHRPTVHLREDKLTLLNIFIPPKPSNLTLPGSRRRIARTLPPMPGGKGKSVGGGKAAPKDANGKGPRSHSAKAGLQVGCHPQ